VVEDVTGDVIVRAIQSAFSGHSVGEFRSWLNTITDRATADFYRARARRPEETPLESEGEEGHAHEPAAPDGRGYVEVQMVIEDLLGELRPDHRRVVELVVFEDQPAGAVASDVEGMSSANVYQVASRFRASLRERLAPASDRRGSPRRRAPRAPPAARDRSARSGVDRAPNARRRISSGREYRLFTRTRFGRSVSGRGGDPAGAT